MVVTPISTTPLAALPPNLIGQGPGVSNFVIPIGFVFRVNITNHFVEKRLQTYWQFLSDDQNAGKPETLEYRETMRRLLEEAGIADTFASQRRSSISGQSSPICRPSRTTSCFSPC